MLISRTKSYRYRQGEGDMVLGRWMVAGDRILWDRRKDVGFGKPWLRQHGCNVLVRSDQGNRKEAHSVS